MSEQVPIIKLGEQLLITLQGDLEDSTIERMERDITHEVVRTRTTGVMLDVSRLSVVDSFVARVLARLVGMIRLLGADTTIVGIQPAVAIALVELGVSMGHVDTALNAEQGMARLRGRRHDRVN
jgi:rsbT antagonist protein RsbS